MVGITPSSATNVSKSWRPNSVPQPRRQTRPMPDVVITIPLFPSRTRRHGGRPDANCNRFGCRRH
jgi:hypothetical protein